MKDFNITHFDRVGDDITLMVEVINDPDVDNQLLEVKGEVDNFDDHWGDNAKLTLHNKSFDALHDAGLDGDVSETLMFELNKMMRENIKYRDVSVTDITSFEVAGEGEYAYVTVDVEPYVLSNFTGSNVEDDTVISEVRVAIGHLPESGGWTASVDEEDLEALKEMYGDQDFESHIEEAINEYMDVDMVMSKHLSEGASVSENMAKTIISSISSHKRHSFSEKKFQVDDYMTDVLLDNDLPSDLYIEASCVEYADEFGGEMVDAGLFSFSLAGKEYFIDGIEMNDGLYADDPVFIPQYVEKELVSAGVPEHAAVAISRAADSVWKVQMEAEERLGREQRVNRIDRMSM